MSGGADPQFPLADVPETELVQRAQCGDETAFAELMRRNASTSFRLALSVLKDRQEAEDEVQNSFFKAWRRLGTFQFESRFSTWFRTIVLNQSLMRLRVVKRVGMRSIDDTGADSSDRPREYATDEATAEQSLADTEIVKHLRAETQKLPPLLRDVLVMRDLEERSIEEIAAALDITESAVKSRLARARPMLRERMERHTKRPVSPAARPVH
ncbi:sigma-24 [Bryobacterales bacterium F-183]|nr:sigma-24 [Bryobacterales bacterium F-183]